MQDTTVFDDGVRLTARVHLRLPPAFHDRVLAAAAAQGLTFTEFARRAMAERLERMGQTTGQAALPALAAPSVPEPQPPTAAAPAVVPAAVAPASEPTPGAAPTPEPAPSASIAAAAPAPVAALPVPGSPSPALPETTRAPASAPASVPIAKPTLRSRGGGWG